MTRKLNDLAVRFHAVLEKHQGKVGKEWDHAHIKLPFTLDEVQDFLAGKPGRTISNKYGGEYTRSHQVRQVHACIGARLVDQDKADQETYDVYKAVWAVEVKTLCPYCQRNYSMTLCFPTDHCKSRRCMMNYIMDSV